MKDISEAINNLLNKFKIWVLLGTVVIIAIAFTAPQFLFVLIFPLFFGLFFYIFKSFVQPMMRSMDAQFGVKLPPEFDESQETTRDISRWDAILSCAQSKGGRLTAADVSIYFNVDLQTAEVRLDQCVESGHADLYVSQSGVKVYQFSHIISDDEKKRAEPV
ncbi:MAG TPA: hypothetical protein PLH27_13885 [bacterium]|nr:hypothetical protein [bacterium]